MVDTAHTFVTDGTYYLPLPFVNTTINACIKLSVTKTIISMANTENRSSYNGFVTVLYTKTTD